MSNYLFHDENTLAEKAEELGKKAVKLGIISSFIVHHYPDSQEFCLPEEDNSNILTAPEAYMKFKKLVDSALSQV
ncbi:hypothetical protein ACN23B_25025 [Anabaena sp. FACHB-709]|jgi:hypothetical protein|uniref:Uncharacterized protein n=2 Tax=Nostocaceae TaxID=1162 RepID=A0A1Z4KNY5_ANAVA|nr:MULTISPECIES: hypothetical protein [Nostocaceae]BAY70593.1 hypothetical protein NIES23_34000 [Trichormus variabilis NIES-23]HBW31511.1 hypothetical protein [Nostoc sp. UBA8866]MBD2172558.1 hypothetical protein [Anabaena cylindrica FACHB-318]MBD2264470.1 hypothetical protein [Anabaena sp. FACHB-709]MBD2274241.1 hypothetical protein [Nostoc sp. PCC 7120 = FACHB-418]